MSDNLPEWTSDGIIDGLMQEQWDRPLVRLPALCPSCGKIGVHFLFHENRDRRGGGWCWCSECRGYGHGVWKMPPWWVDSPQIPLSLLTVVPVKLEPIKDVVDAHWNKLFDAMQE